MLQNILQFVSVCKSTNDNNWSPYLLGIVEKFLKAKTVWIDSQFRIYCWYHIHTDFSLVVALS